MRKFLLAATAAVALGLAMSPASAHPYHHHSGYHYAQKAPRWGWGRQGWGFRPWGYSHYPRSHYRTQRRSYAGGDAGRPGDCYGIAWCGCYLRHILGIADTSFNLAIHWLSYGHAVAGPQPGAIAVGPHHVAKLIKPVGGGKWLIQDGNDGPVRIHERSIAWAHWFRMG